MLPGLLIYQLLVKSHLFTASRGTYESYLDLIINLIHMSTICRLSWKFRLIRKICCCTLTPMKQLQYKQAAYTSDYRYSCCGDLGINFKLPALMITVINHNFCANCRENTMPA